MTIEVDAADPVTGLAMQAAVIAEAIGTIQLALARGRECLSTLAQPAQVVKLAKGRREIGQLGETFRTINSSALPTIAAELKSFGAVIGDAAWLAHLPPLTQIRGN